MGRKSKVALYADCVALIDGLGRGELAKTAEFTLGGKTYKRQELIDLFQSLLDAETVTRSTYAAYLHAARKERALRERIASLQSFYKQHLESQYGKASDRMTLAGFRSKLPQQPSADTKAKAVEKRRATRTARKTIGPKQRKRIKGDPSG